ncbi:MAG TPA: hypothetical protein PL051_00770 [Candidatus Saccharibacteria bacterium]|nr:hypothetical protein [Candidatus Saccharibacteria bacterium]
MLIRRVRHAFVAVVVAIGCVSVSSNVYAVQPQSSSYRFDETSIGTGGLFDSSSTNYTSQVGAGDIGIGRAASSNFQAEAGSRTTNDPVLKFAVLDADVSFGVLSPSTTLTADASFEVTNYTSYGYVVQILGTAPTSASNVIDALTTGTAPAAGIEQFGINLVANTDPTSFGANPDNGSYGFGEAAPNYATTNEYRYVSGETIAFAPKDSGKTTYTMSYIINVNSFTPPGQYTTDQTLVVTGTY